MGIDLYVPRGVPFPDSGKWLDQLDREYAAEWAARDNGLEPAELDTWERYQAAQAEWVVKHGVSCIRLSHGVGDLLEAAGFAGGNIELGAKIPLDVLELAANVHTVAELWDPRILEDSRNRLNDLVASCKQHGDDHVVVG